MKILLDTDIGTDIDDAVALAYLLARPDCELLGITTVSGESERRAMIASALCRHVGREIPIAPGIEAPLLGPQRQPHPQQAEALARWPHRSSDWAGNAIDLMRATIRRWPGEVTLVSIGPLTNVAALCTIDPEAVAMLRGLVVMAGDFSPQPDESEWNVQCDPHAAAIVFKAAFPRVRCLPVNVTAQVALTEAEVVAQFHGALREPVLDFAAWWFALQRPLSFHDPLAAAAAFDDSSSGFRRGSVTVDLGPPVEGQTRWIADETGPHEVAFEVDRARYLEHFLQVIQGQ